MVRAVTAVALTPSWAKVLQKGQSTDSLLKKLKDLQKILARPEVKELNEPTLKLIRDQLIQEQLLFHNSKEVRSSLACCLADLLRLCAPDSPFDNTQLQTIFQFFLAVLTKPSGGLSKPNGPLFSDACILLENLTTTKSVLLIFDLDACETLMSEYFSRFLSIIKPDIPKRVELATANLLADLVKESDVPKKVIDILLGHFHPSVKKTNPAASQLATLICKEANNDLQMHVNRHISDLIVKATSKDETPEMEQALQKIHLLIIHINKSAPEVLVSVIPQLESGMRAENDTLREASVRTLSQMFAEKASLEGGGGHLAQKYVSTWKAWIARCLDKSASIRTIWAEATRGLIINHPELWPDLEPCIIQKLLDPDEKVRMAMLKSFKLLDYETLLHNVSRKVLRAIGDRALDKKEAVRLEAFQVIGKAFSLAYPEMQSGEKTVKDQFLWIPNFILSTTSQGLQLTQVPIQHILAKYILPLSNVGQEDEVMWTERFLFVLQSLEQEQVNRLLKMSNLLGTSPPFVAYIEACKKFNGGVVEGSHERINATKMALLRPIEQIASQYSDPAFAAKELNEFAKQNDARAYKSISIITDSRTDLKSYVGAMNVIQKKLRSSSGKSNVTVEAAVLMVGYPFINTSSIPTLLTTLQTVTDADSDADLAQGQSSRIYDLLKAMANKDASLFLNHIGMLHQLLGDGKSKAIVKAICVFAMAKIYEKKVNGDKMTFDKAGIKKIQHFIQKGSHLEAKYAAKLLALLRNSDEESSSDLARQAVEQLCEEIGQNLAKYDAGRLSASMACLKQFAKHANDAIVQCDELVGKVVQDVLTKPWSAENTTKESAKGEEDEDWVEDDALNDELRARVTAIQFLTQQCLSCPEESEVVNTLIKPVLKLLFTCLTHGQPKPNLHGNAIARSRIRCVSALSLLKLSRRASCEKNITWQNFQEFATTVQDETFQVRERFLNKLKLYCLKRSANLPPRYFTLGFMTAFDPEDDNRTGFQVACTTLRGVMTQELRLKYFDLGLARLLHLLNHYPDFIKGGLNDLESLKSAAVYLDFYFDCCANENNLACLYYIANRCKGHQDIEGVEASKGLYKLSELAMCLIKRRADAMACNVGNWAGKVSLPVDIFQPLPSRANQNEIYKRSYLSDEEVEVFQQQPIRRPAAASLTKRKAITASKEGGGSKKRAKIQKSATKTKTTSKSRRKSGGKRKQESDEEEEDSEMSDAIEEIDDKIMSEAESEIMDTDDGQEISDDEEVESSADEATEGRGARIKEKRRKDKLARNESRAKRRQEQQEGVN